MLRSKKFIVGAVLAVVVLVASVGGVVLAQDNEEETSRQTLIARVATILGIDQQTVEDAFTQAQSEMRGEAVDNYLNNLVEQGKITQEEAGQYKDWWLLKPDVPVGPRFGGRGGFRRGGCGFGSLGMAPLPQATN
ncbi:MAG: hypothetical protein ABIB93_03845 [Chloroflexota bacterium]